MGGGRDDRTDTELPSPFLGDEAPTRETRTNEGLPSIRDVDTHGLAVAQLRDPERYLILGEHGRGGLGRVSRAHDRELGRDVAIKELISRDRVSEGRFLREALITARLEHPSIVAVHEAGRWPDGTPFYAMKLVSGRPLRELIAERKTADERLGLLHHVIAVADAIAYAHGRHIVHRDLKPSNIIVGDFGETVVIDWGLAKDLTATEDSDAGNGPSLASGDNELTVAGSVLGTPAYMAPEQARGDQVDQRADVFAIGTMLWELCALRRLPPSDTHRRRRLLRRAGIDRDLATIIEKCLEPDPARRYPDAGALATDLKAFKAGARIAARNYTLLAMLAHWIRRHRALALSATVLVAVAAAGVALFVRNIAVERDRADTALAHVEAAKSDLTLEHADLLLHSDPTAAVATLSEYRGRDTVRRQRLLAEARGRGVARAVHTPHSDTVWFLVGDASGEIISLGEDRRIQLTRGTLSTTIASDVSTSVLVAYAPSQHLLAYATSPPGIAIIDLRTRISKRIAEQPPRAMAFAPDGSRLAALEKSGELVVWSTQPRIQQIYSAVVPGAASIAFMTPSRLVVHDRTAIRAIALGDAGGNPDVSALPEATEVDARGDAVAAGTSDGSIVVLSSSLSPLARASVCHKRLATLRFVPHSDLLAFSCQDWVTGVARYDAVQRSVTVVDTFATRGVSQVFPDFLGRYVAVIDESKTAYVYDNVTRLVSQYDGNAGQPSYVATPTPEFDGVLIGDVNGAVRVWDRPTEAARALLHAPEAVFGVAFTPDSKALITDGNDGIVRRIQVEDGTTTELSGHNAIVIGVRAAPDGSSFLSRSYDGSVRTWRVGEASSLRRFAEHGGLTQDIDYVERGRRIASVGDDGRLLLWSPQGGDVEVLFKHSSPLTALEILTRNDHAVIADAAGTMWDVSLGAEARKVRTPDRSTLTFVRASPDGSYLAVATEAALVTVYETSSWHVVKTIQGEGGVRQIAFDPVDRDLLIAWEASHTPLGRIQVVPLGMQRPFPWHEVPAAVRDVAYAPDGETIGFVCADGGTWLYTLRGDSWEYARDHDTDVFTGRFSPDGRWFATSDRRGVVVLRNVASSLATGH